MLIFMKYFKDVYKTLGEDQRAAFHYLRGQWEDEARLLTDVHGGITRDNSHKLKKERIYAK